MLPSGDARTATAAPSRSGWSSNRTERTNGVVEHAAPEFEEWIGRRSHMSGNFEWVIIDGMPVPSHGDGIFRLN